LDCHWPRRASSGPVTTSRYACAFGVERFECLACDHQPRSRRRTLQERWSRIVHLPLRERVRQIILKSIIHEDAGAASVFR
jgi:hypothetical protein